MADNALGAGAGFWRSREIQCGPGYRTVVELRCDQKVVFNLAGDRAKIPSRGLFEGKPGRLSEFYSVRQGKRLKVSPMGWKITSHPLEAGDVLWANAGI